MNKFEFKKDSRNVWHCYANGIEYRELCIMRNGYETVDEFFHSKKIVENIPALKNAVENKCNYYEIPNCVNPLYFSTLKEAKAFINKEFSDKSAEYLEYYIEEC